MQLVSCVIVLILGVLTMAKKPHYDLEQSEALFEKFAEDYNRHYVSDVDKEDHYNAFVASLVRINRNNKLDSATYDINNFTDYTPEEIKNLKGYGPLIVYE